MELATGSFVGNATVDRAITGLGFSPDVVILRSTSISWGLPLIQTSTTLGGSKMMSSNAAMTTALITSLDADGFTVSSHPRVNANGDPIH
jgi:hypothetical protein